ncbi:cytochrome-c oxidase, cbb3-type subunit III [Neomegalonema perideroedes]|uniref:cytochrome-c oxidase, cbb3-type subunit III n=1 Tax=Neomegalonema perideroedes TaxID=217219 RepID=UPI00036705EA|nr:cytochrome-c oxidase, cbb3-type subunit III [Neomegalonema perideroedes]
MALTEKDPITGRETTGHEWNGIKELNTPIPRVVFLFLGLTFAFSLLWWALMPAWPLGASYTRGLLGADHRQDVSRALGAAQLDRQAWTQEMESLPYAEIEARPDLMRVVSESGRRLFGDNCAACHGAEGRGGPGFPDLSAKLWLWGGELETIEETLRVGINSTHEETRYGQMLAFGRDGMLSRPEIASVISFLRAHAQNVGEPDPRDAQGAEAGAEIFAEQCVSCHGEDARGLKTAGAPDLTDGYWLYGGDRASLTQTLVNGRQGHMPHWEDRLSLAERRILTLYVLGLKPPEGGPDDS